MPIILLTETKEEDINLLSNADVEYVSLVRHGANRMPFRVVKSDKKEGDKMGLAVQSILIQKGVDISGLSSKESLGWLSEAKVEAPVEFDTYAKHIQLPEDSIKPGTMKLIKIDEDAWVLAGELDGKADGNILTLGESSKKVGEIPEAPMDAVIGNTSTAQAVAASFRDLFEKELMSMLDIVHGSLKQSSAEPKKRKATIIGAVDAFKSFLSVGLDAIGAEAAKIDMPEKSDKGGDDMFKDKEEFVTAVKETVTPMVAEIVTESVKKVFEDLKELDSAEDNTDSTDKKVETEKVDKTDATDEPNALTEIQTALKSVGETVEGLAKKVDDLGNQSETTPSNQDTEDKVDKKDGEQDEDSDNKGKKSVFRGLLTSNE